MGQLLLPVQCSSRVSLETPAMHKACVLQWSRLLFHSLIFSFHSHTAFVFTSCIKKTFKNEHFWMFLNVHFSWHDWIQSELTGDCVTVFSTVSWSECSFSVCCRAGGWLCRWQKWRGPGTEAQLWPKSTDSPAVICHPTAETHRHYSKHLDNVRILKWLKTHRGGLPTTTVK